MTTTYNWRSVSFDQLLLFCPPPTPNSRDHYHVLCIWVHGFADVFLSDLYHLPWCPHVFASDNNIHSFLWLNITLCVSHIFIHSFIDSYLVCFHTLAIVKNVAMNMRCRYPFKLAFSFSLDKSPMNCWLYGSSIFSFLRIHHTAYHSHCTNLHSHPQYTRVPFLHVLANIFLFDNSQFNKMRWHLIHIWVLYIFWILTPCKI